MTTLTEKLSQQLKNNLNEPLIKDENLGVWFTGRDLQADVDQLRAAFTANKLGYGDQLLVCLPNSAVFPVINQAAWELGIIVHPISPTTPIAELRVDWHERHYAGILLAPALAAELTEAPFVASTLNLHTVAKLPFLVDSQQLAGRLVSSSRRPQENDLGLILNTSGTTGKPKRVGLTHAMLVSAAQNDISSNHMTAADVAMINMPMFHINAQVMSTLSTRLAGGKILVTPKFSASKFWQQVKDNGVTWVSVVPTIITFLLLNDNANQVYRANAADIHLRYVRSSSFALPEDKLRAFQDNFDTLVIEGYGMTEAASQCTINPFDAPKIGSAGKPFGTELSILVDGEFTTEANVLGEIVIKGDHVITQYMDPNPDSFKAGWFLTGDLGYLDEDGYLFVKGRSKEIISRGGEKVAPAAVENVLNELDFIEQLSVIGMPDDLYGEEVTAVVISTTPGLNEAAQRQQLFDYAQEHLAKYETPTRVEFVREFPRNMTGKVLRPQLREQLLTVGAAK
ncbi:AMP-binding protein [Loigolactobacillus zhaoyuanensis]|uniref:AMP-binding protein n=1 Tax=Loigolactobacillus zhaoyuanensis TaxID=2486017 RepID=A0ABW8UF85_9LACO|nr:AMP-binding protein [Loigolactobacillus zhaoyuanensis]